MTKEIEIYVRNSGDKTHLVFYIPSEMREQFIQGVQHGSFVVPDADVHLELSVLPDWVTNEDAKEVVKAKHSIHTRLQISQLIFNFDTE